ncbi:hypothetical protein COT62_02870 [Candidatus Roizmanbacteria bacterium CG09_land_8_20_14_0_10_41_9]|uniref:Aminoacyl-transfer RNA synthetases class-II family profile domain-containing protein n=1 Tax=Candidatus Roizmanbacteria bacterium CG09_land_8_20_14_0_10_41_9 TaxID=1974850 RepID=A0A2H0WSE0_9BACT|nr:MAG: hypothetical protein COT62_02870 [Candidatus Roizmanbacteria bacterium CG09_land_8_20_14_0_10_41_9]
MQIHTNPQNLKYYKVYLKVEEGVHSFLKKNGYLKIDVPVLSPALIPESYLEVFKTEYRFFNRKEPLYLTPSPELFLKRILSKGVGNCYSLVKAFRNHEPPSSLHSFEFTMLEIYKLNSNYLDLAEDLLALLRHLCNQIFQKDHLVFKGVIVDFRKWEKITVSEAFRKFASVNERELFDRESFLRRAKKKGYVVDGYSYEDLFSQIYVQEIEPNLGKNGFPTLIYDYPRQFAALAKLNKDKKTAQRFEFYIAGVELGDCYSELTDWKEQEARFVEEEKKRLRTGKIMHPVDKDFLEALQYGLENCAGIAIGFERLAMIFAGAASIQELKLITITDNL